MPHNPPNIALLLFTRTPAEEVRHKKLVPFGSMGQQCQLATKLVQNSQEVLAATGLPYFILSSEQQIGGSFGERLYNAFARVFAMGYDQVITIGNDCPQLQPRDIIMAVNRLAVQEVVLGPDKTGGIYLLGLSRQVFQTCRSFAGIRWNTGSVLADAQAFFRIQALPFVLSKKLFHINTSQDLLFIIKRKLLNTRLLKFFKRLLGFDLPGRQTLNIFFFTHHLLRPLLFRGPPSSVSGFPIA